ncbi:MAG: peptidase U34, partial [Halieaceae bacterium]|nr:peptidase U34 [Halieaceae bacterium]
YGVDKERYPRSDMEKELRLAAPINLRGMMNAVRDPRIAKDSTGYGQVAQLKNNGRPDMNLLWIAPTGSVTAPFIPYRIGTESIAPQFGKHRYLTKGEATGFITPDWQIQEATEFAGRLFKRLMYYTCDHPDVFLPEVNNALTAFENRLIAEQQDVAETANTLYGAGKKRLARRYLAQYSKRRGAEGLQLGRALLASIEARTEVLFGLRKPEFDIVSRLSYDRVSCLPKN